MLIRRPFFIYIYSSLALCTFSHTAEASHFNLCLPSQSFISNKISKHHFRHEKYLHKKYKLDALPLEDITQEVPTPLWFDPNSPTFAEQLLAIFGKTSLSLRLQDTEKKTTKKRILGFQKKKTKISKKEKEKLWVSEVFGEISKMLPFQNGMDIGSNSNSDVYIEVNAEKNWELFANWKLDASQTFRYASQSKNYSETDFNFTQERSDKNLASNQFSIVKSYAEEFTWSDKLFMQKKFLNNKSITYGIYTSGIYSKEKKDVELQSWGPYLGWRIPIWRNWVFLENDISYYRDSTATDGYSFSSNIQLEATF